MDCMFSTSFCTRYCWSGGQKRFVKRRCSGQVAGCGCCREQCFRRCFSEPGPASTKWTTMWNQRRRGGQNKIRKRETETWPGQLLFTSIHICSSIPPFFPTTLDFFMLFFATQYHWWLCECVHQKRHPALHFFKASQLSNFNRQFAALILSEVIVTTPPKTNDSRLWKMMVEGGSFRFEMVPLYGTCWSFSGRYMQYTYMYVYISLIERNQACDLWVSLFCMAFAWQLFCNFFAPLFLVLSFFSIHDHAFADSKKMRPNCRWKNGRRTLSILAEFTKNV